MYTFKEFYILLYSFFFLIFFSFMLEIIDLESTDVSPEGFIQQSLFDK